MKIDPIHAAGIFKRAITGSISLLGLTLAHLTPAAEATAESFAPPEHYTWSAELVDRDAARNRNAADTSGGVPIPGYPFDSKEAVVSIRPCNDVE